MRQGDKFLTPLFSKKALPFPMVLFTFSKKLFNEKLHFAEHLKSYTKMTM